jgi:hypothetical protein
MNKRGITFFYTLMLGVTIIVLGLALASPTKDFIDDARDGMSCTATNLSIYDEATCVGYDALKPLISGGIILIGFAVIGAKIIWGM